jgi:hypothetical protein
MVFIFVFSSDKKNVLRFADLPNACRDENETWVKCFNIEDLHDFRFKSRVDSDRLLLSIETEQNLTF